MSLERFTDAQERVWPVPLEEIQRGRKDSHWMWFVFPQLKGLGRSATALHYGIAGRAEAEAYLAHPVLGTRLVEISRAMLSHADTAPETILGPVDALKLRSSATLFEAVGGDPVFAQMIEAFFDRQRCEKTLDLLS